MKIVNDFIDEIIDEGCTIENRTKFEEYLKEKSVYRYRQIHNFLKLAKRPVTDKNLHDFYIYDIRVRRLLFKYLTAYEILLRAKVLNKVNSEHKILDEYSFGQLIHRYYLDDKSCEKIRLLRNYVMHHRMIQLCDESTVLNGINSLLETVDRDQFLEELKDKKRDLELIYFYFDMKGVVEYGMGI